MKTFYTNFFIFFNMKEYGICDKNINTYVHVLIDTMKSPKNWINSLLVN